MIKNTKMITKLFACTFTIALALFMFNSPKAEAATGFYMNNFNNFPGFNQIYSQKANPIQQIKPNPTPAARPNSTPITTPAPAASAPVSTSGLTAEEQQMVNLVNQERAKTNLQPLTVDMRLVNVARMKSQDMIDNNYFSHQSPTYGSPFDMMKSQGISFSYAGENIAANQSVGAAHTALMNSSGHRANILNSNYEHIGVGIAHGGPYGMMFTQEFTN
ncbi:CAP domain-containing protein [Pelotomaculum terephthalicicum JT]|uniref:CAP domain-containing protein n=1 Tax=Pelotomaculum terephthalicicum TaxID=206393 RepID=UPI001F03F205|nr:CAP domain-containing protein [Pelotomaculum terephthalicicum]MCG9969719.1 CAP domain-containing protein [Pelotomaculum terephthalicicum JT]